MLRRLDMQGSLKTSELRSQATSTGQNLTDKLGSLGKRSNAELPRWPDFCKRVRTTAYFSSSEMVPKRSRELPSRSHSSCGDNFPETRSVAGKRPDVTKTNCVKTSGNVSAREAAFKILKTVWALQDMRRNAALTATEISTKPRLELFDKVFDENSGFREYNDATEEFLSGMDLVEKEFPAVANLFKAVYDETPYETSLKK